MKSYRVILFLIAILFLFTQYENRSSGINYRNSYSKKIFIPAFVRNKLASGDIILRSGKGFISDVFKQFSLKDKTYSHAGIVSIEKDGIFVYHILGEEQEDGRINSGSLKKDLLETFCNPDENRSYAVYRYDLSALSKEKMINRLKTASEEKIIFDSQFDLASDSAMYCTELIYKVVTSASADKDYIPVTIVDEKKYIAPYNLYLNRHATFVYSNIF